LAQLGFNIVLISRNHEKLRATIDNLKKFRPPNSKAEFRSITFNFKDSSNKDRFRDLLSQL
jgi:17beta-estradiol 17-dehydrogenase / very-long-chain 3-oxoacyl-CoA reductase